MSHRPLNRTFAGLGTTIFSVMSALAVEHKAVNLGQGFPDEDGPEDLRRIAAEALIRGPNQYPPMTGLPVLREAVATANARFYGLKVDPATEVIVTSGATEALADCILALVNPGDEVILIEPAYDSYRPMIEAVGGVVRAIRVHPPEWNLDPAELAAAFGPKTKAILFNTPMNPVGKVFTKPELELIASLLQRFDAYAICDEVYEHLLFDGRTHLPLMTLPGMRERCLRIGSAGKTFSMTGWKVGYITGPKALMSVVAKAHQFVTFTTPNALQIAVAEGLRKEAAYFDGLAADMQAKRDLLRDALTAAGVPTLPCEGTYFLVADIARWSGGAPDTVFCERLVKEAGVATIPLSAFYAKDAPQNLIRFAFCKRPETLREASGRLAARFRAAA